MKTIILKNGQTASYYVAEATASGCGSSRTTDQPDFIHVPGYLRKAAYLLHAVGSKEAEDWMSEQAFRILQGEAAGVAIEIRRSTALRKLSAGKRKAVDKCSDYLEK